MTNEENVACIIESMDRTRIDLVGGYYSDWMIQDGKVIWANLDAGKEYAKTLLVVQPLAEFIKQYEWLLSEIEEL